MTSLDRPDHPDHADQAPDAEEVSSGPPGGTASGGPTSGDTNSGDNTTGETASGGTSTGDTWSDVRALTVPIVATIVVGVAITAWGYATSGGPGLLAGALGALVSLGFFLGGQLILARILRTNPMISMGVAMAVYLAQILILFLLIAVLKNASFFDPRVFGFTIIGCVLTWTLSSLTSMKKMSQALAVPADDVDGPDVREADGSPADGEHTPPQPPHDRH